MGGPCEGLEIGGPCEGLEIGGPCEEPEPTSAGGAALGELSSVADDFSTTGAAGGMEGRTEGPGATERLPAGRGGLGLF